MSRLSLVTCITGAICFLPFVAASQSGSSPVRIMPLGDSITAGSTDTDHYRSWLWKQLTGKKLAVDFVGSAGKIFGISFGKSDYDSDHEGHWAWTTNQVLEKIDGWARISKPDIVLIHLGTNDVFQGIPSETAVDNLSAIIDRARSANPKAVFLVAKIISARGMESGVQQLNEMIDAVIPKKSTPESPVHVVAMPNDFDVESDTSDGAHPNEAGAKKMASAWAVALEPLL